MMKKGAILAVAVLAVFVVSLFGCGKKNEAAASIQTSTITRNKPKAAIQSISDNPGFYSASSTTLASAEAKQLDGLIRPILKKLFEDAKVVADLKSPETARDGEVIENRITYVVKMLLVPEEGRNLHAALLAANFGPSPRLGSKPTLWKGGAVMSLFKTTSQRPYSLVFKLDCKKQQIVVESYKLGSKYDRLM